MKIGNITLKNNLILAPMASASDFAFRALAIESGADYAVTEMISAKGLLHNNKRTLELLYTTDTEKIKVVQLFGHQPEIMAKACASKHLQAFDIIDINMGCPAPKIVKNGDGCALMKDINLAKSVIESCVKATDKPITVKFRLGWEDVNAVAFAKMCEQAGASAITVHGRLKTQFYSGVADYNEIAKVVNAVNIPVIANGDVDDLKSYNNILNTTKCAAVMVGRAALGNPGIFYKLRNIEDKNNKFYYISKHVNILRQYYADSFLTKYMKKHFLWYLKNERNAQKTKLFITKSDNLDEMLGAIKRFLK